MQSSRHTRHTSHLGIGSIDSKVTAVTSAILLMIYITVSIIASPALGSNTPAFYPRSGPAPSLPDLDIVHIATAWGLMLHNRITRTAEPEPYLRVSIKTPLVSGY